jgi:hypothetical protein
MRLRRIAVWSKQLYLRSREKRSGALILREFCKKEKGGACLNRPLFSIAGIQTVDQRLRYRTWGGRESDPVFVGPSMERAEIDCLPEG